MQIVNQGGVDPASWQCAVLCSGACAGLCGVTKPWKCAFKPKVWAAISAAVAAANLAAIWTSI